ncbi:MAG: GPR endopeptidase [Eubacterium sp.]|nr:GPR endopeptidase [Eubacterium sp.]
MNNSHYYTHTDLALEIQEDLLKDKQEQGYKVKNQEYYNHRIRETTITIKTSQAARLFGKFPGTYVTLEGVDLSENDGGFHEEMSRCIALNLEKLLGKSRKILIVGLGNRNIMADALGPLVVDHLMITRPVFCRLLSADGDAPVSCREGILRENAHKLQDTYNSSDPVRISSAIAPGVMAQTGMETVEILRGIIGQTSPEKIIVIDALAARNLDRLGSTVQLSSTGIAPGSGVGNRRKEISQAALGIPVIAVGVPTVISIPSVASDILAACADHMSEAVREELERLTGTESEDHYRRLASILDRRLFGFTMTPKDVDEAVHRISFTISEGINQVIGSIPS